MQFDGPHYRKAGGDTAVPMDHERGSSVTVGLGDGIVIPLESYSWDMKASELSIMFIDNPATSELTEANVKGKHYATGFLSTLGLKSDMTDVMVSSMSYSGEGGNGRPLVTVVLNFKTVEHKPAR